MATISLRVNADDEKIIKEYAKLKNISVSTLLRDAVFEKIEDEIDLNLYKQAMQEHQENPDSISFEKMLEELAD